MFPDNKSSPFVDQDKLDDEYSAKALKWFFKYGIILFIVAPFAALLILGAINHF